MEGKSVTSIEKPRLIAALLSELEAADAIVLATNTSTQETFQSSIQCKLAEKFSESLIQLLNIKSIDEIYECVCCFSGQRLQFKLLPSCDGKFFLPQVIDAIELRELKRVQFGNRNYSVEIVLKTGSLYGYAVDLNHNYIAVDVDSKSDIGVGVKVKLIVRLVNANTDVFYRNCTLTGSTQTTSGETRLIFDTNSSYYSEIDRRIYARGIVENQSIDLSSSDFLDDHGRLGLVISNISLGGMTVYSNSSSKFLSVLPGMILNSQYPKLNFIVVWNRDGKIGLKPIVLDSVSMSEWYKFFEKVCPFQGHKSVLTRKEIANVLTNSGLLKGKRRNPFGKHIVDHIVSSSSESPLLTIRYLIVGDLDDAGCHLTSRRISEKLWCITDGASVGTDAATYEKVFFEVIGTIARVSSFSDLFPRYFCSVLSKSISSSDKILNGLAKGVGHFLFDSFHFSISKVVVSETFIELPLLNNVYDLDASLRRSIASKFSPEIFEAFFNHDGSHPVLSSELGKLGSYHHVESKTISLKSGKIVLAHRLFTHGIWHTTGVTNSVFLLLPRDLSSDELNLTIQSVSKDSISFGTDDLLLIVDGEKTDFQRLKAEFPDSKHFEVHLHDLKSGRYVFREPEEKFDLTKRSPQKPR